MARGWSRLLVEWIDPVLAGSPFQAGQTGEPPEDAPFGLPSRRGASGIWCGGYDEVIEAYPHLARPGVEPEDNWCFDITVEIDAHGRLVEVRLEFDDLAEAFVAMGREDDASAADRLLGRPAEEAVPQLAALLARMFPPPGPAEPTGS